jgi:glycosyltransferase involved in cell wall biosynthesis
MGHLGEAMRVAYISLFRPGFGGGEGQLAHELARQLAKRHDVLLICPHSRTQSCVANGSLQLLGIQSAGEGNVAVPVLSKANLTWLLDRLGGFAPEIVHAHEPVSLALVGQIWAKSHGVPFVYTAHVLASRFMDFGVMDVFQGIRSSLTESVAQQFLSSFYAGCDAIVALNELAGQDLRAFGYTGRILTIPNGRDLGRYRASPITDPGTTRKQLSFVGFVSERKNQLYLLQMLRHLPPNYELQVVGPLLDPAYGEQLARFANEHGLTSIVFTGPVAHDAIPGLLGKTHVFVSASKMEVQSLSVIEALASGTPVVGLANETIDELVDDQVGRRLPGDAMPETFAEAVNSVCRLPPAEYRQLCASARERVGRFGWPNVIAMTEAAYRSLIPEAQPEVGWLRPRIMDVVARIPSEEIRHAIAERAIALDQAVQRIPTDAMWTLIRNAKLVSRPTRLFVLATLLFSGLAYLVVQSRRFVRREAARARREKELCHVTVAGRPHRRSEA